MEGGTVGALERCPLTRQAEGFPVARRPRQTLALRLLVTRAISHQCAARAGACRSGRRARAHLGRRGIDVDHVPGRILGAGLERDGSRWVLIPPGILILARETISCARQW